MKFPHLFLLFIPKLIEARDQKERRNNAPSMSISLISTPTTITNPSGESNIILPPSLDGVIVVPAPNDVIFPDMNFPPSFLDLSIPNTADPTFTSSQTLDPVDVMLEPTKAPVLKTSSPTKEVTLSPTNIPVVVSTVSPTSTPTSPKTESPTDPIPITISTVSPTSTPTQPKTESPQKPIFPVAKNYPSNWFDYNPSSKYGPKEWDNIQLTSSFYFNYIKEKTNECSKDEQSPIDLVPNNDCMDDHSPGQDRGKHKFQDLKFSIESSGLRAVLEGGDDKPKLDFSNLSDFIPAAFVNVKVPSEHLIEGKSFAGEFQIYHYWDKGNGRFVVISILMDDTEDKEHEQLQQFIQEWEEVALKKENECLRKVDPSTPPFVGKEKLSEDEMAKIWNVKISDDKSDYNLYKFMTTGWYYGYNGSLTEPPCSRRLHYRILDIPMKVSKTQIQKIQNLILNRLNDDCQVETAFAEGVNRPIQKTTEKVWHCTSEDWKFKVEKDPSYWLDSWPIGYHGWEVDDKFKLP